MQTETVFRRCRLRGALAGVAVVAGVLSASAWSQTFPSRPVRLLVGFTPGTTTDIIARIVALRMADSLGQQVVVENVAGASGNLAGAAAARAQPDGHTLLLGGTSLIVSPHLYRKLPYDPPRDLVPVGLIAMVPNVLVVHPSLPARDLKALLALARAKPGGLDYSSSGKGSAGHLSMELLKSMAGVDIVEVPYKSSAQALSDVVGGQISMNFPSLAAALPQIRPGRVRALAVSGSKRSGGAPDIPTVAEAGALPAYEANGWYGLFAPAATPREVIARINAEMVRVVHLPDVRERLSGQGADVVGGKPEELAEALRGASERWGKLIRQLGLSLD
jgi:tripartite-type tricarboxylate transporter receptor subunit TctC